LIPEPMFRDLAGKDKPYKTIYEYAQSHDYPVESILEAAKTSVKGDIDHVLKYLGYMRDPHPVIRYWGAYGIFLARPESNQAREALRTMAKNDGLAVNRLMAAQALGIKGNKEEAFRAILKELYETGRVHVFLFGLNALQYSHADRLMTLAEWEKLKKVTFPDDEEEAAFAFHQRIINDAIDLWPERRAVD
jgi:N-sulfoglucosamine sulfohydrolase